VCGRYTLTVDLDDLKEEMGIVETPPPEELPKRFNIAPSQPVPVVTDRTPKKLELFRWGLIPTWTKDVQKARKPINARVESLMEGKSSFRAAFEKRRCLVLADGFYEWKHLEGKRTKQPFYFHRKDGHPFAFAGIWELWRPGKEGEWLFTVAIVTREATPLVAPVHDRMPAILRPEAIARWLAKSEQDPAEIAHLLAPPSDDELETYAVSTLVNKPENDVPELLMPQPESPAELPSKQLRLWES
jgi:putative SOS response-associated peptidase YedK